MCEFCKKISRNEKEYFEMGVNGGDFIFQDGEGFGILIVSGNTETDEKIDEIMKYCKDRCSSEEEFELVKNLGAKFWNDLIAFWNAIDGGLENDCE